MLSYFLLLSTINIVLLSKVFMRMGLPRMLTSDRGKEFRNRLEKEIMSLLGIKRHLVTPYHPQVNQSYLLLRSHIDKLISLP